VTEPRLSVVLVAGTLRDRAQRTLDALGRQTAAHALEVVVVDIAPEGAAFALPTELPVHVLREDLTTSLGSIKANAVRAARALVVAFVEEHAVPEPDWAQALLDAFEEDWAAVGYAFTNLNSATYMSRAVMTASYGPWEHPARRGPCRRLAGNNVAYRRDVLLSFGEELPALLTVDFNLQEAIRARGGGLFLESRALVAHENFTHIGDLLRAGHVYCRLLAARRATSWSILRRAIYALAVPVLAPALMTFRLAGDLRGRRALWWQFLASLPVIVLAYLWNSVGEGLGYAIGARDAEQAFLGWEVTAPRESA
jgi:hypothetical protein